VRLLIESLEDRLTPSTFVVQTTADSGPGSLRDGITQAINNPDPSHDIRFASNVTGTITLSSALPDLAANISITGPGAKALTVARSAAAPTNFSVFTVHSGVFVTIRGLTISGGNATSGGGINNQGTLLLQDSAVTGNTATQQGGGIFSSHGPGTANPSVTVDHSLISNNQITNAAGGGSAGIEITVGTLSLTSSTVTGNNPTGVGIDGGSATILNSTIASNMAANGPNAGGLNAAVVPGLTVALEDTVIAGNTSNGANPPDVNATLVDSSALGGASSGHNLIGAGDGTGLTSGTNGDQVGTAAQPIDPQLAALADNGGATMTMALKPTSPAINSGANPGDNVPLPADQRGLTRVVGGTIDIGAFESGATLVTNTIVVSGPVEPTVGQAVTYTATITPDVTGAAAANATGVLHFTLDGQSEPDGPLTNNQATLSLPNGVTSAGLHTITATYPGDATFLGGTTSFTFPAVSGTTGPGSTPPTVTGNVTSQVNVSLAPAPRVKKHKPRPGSAVLTITNTGGQVILGPLHVELIGLRKKLKVKGASFIGTGKNKIPVLTVTLPGGGLQPGARATLMVQFNGKPNPTITFKVFAATPPM
jgi:hypothetical protein